VTSLEGLGLDEQDEVVFESVWWGDAFSGRSGSGMSSWATQARIWEECACVSTTIIAQSLSIRPLHSLARISGADYRFARGSFVKLS